MRTLNIPGYGEIRLRDKHDELVFKEVYKDDCYRRWGGIQIGSGSTVIDCGAHIGVFSKLASSCGAYVYAIEPHPDNFALLRVNMAHRNAKLLNFAVGDGLPVKFIFDKERNELHKVDPTGTESVPSITLDSVVDKYFLQIIDVLKMDIEGAEYDVLYNFKNLDLVQQLTMEYHYGPVKMAELILFLEDKGLHLAWHGGNHSWGILQFKRNA